MRRIWQMRGFALLLIGGVLATFAWGETVELVTYFPATAQAGDLHLRSLTVGDGFSNENLANGVVLIETSLGIGLIDPLEQLEITGNFRLPNTTAITGLILKDGDRFLHNFGNLNTFLGVNAGNLTMTGQRNVAVGADSFRSNTTGSDLIALGVGALDANTTGINNTAIGNNALLSNTTGMSNTAIGHQALTSNTTGTHNVAIGFVALSDNTAGAANTAVGTSAMSDNISGRSNTGIGQGALLHNTTGSWNTALGMFALSKEISGDNNTALGAFAMEQHEEGNFNTAVGRLALGQNKTGINNTALGYQTGRLNVDGSGNVFIGHQAGFNETGSNRLYIENSNTATPLIYGEFDNNRVLINGSLSLGAVAFPPTSVLTIRGSGKVTDTSWIRAIELTPGGAILWRKANAGGTYYFIAGPSSVPDGDFYTGLVPDIGSPPEYVTVVYGKSRAGSPVRGTTWFLRDVIVSGSFSNPSDVAFKANIQPLRNVLEKLEQVRGISFEWNELYDPTGGSKKGRQIGLIAQELEKVFPELVTTVREGGYRGIDYVRFTAVLLEAIKELKGQNGTLRQRIEALERHEALESQTGRSD